MRRTYPNPVHLPRHRRRLPNWIVPTGWTLLFAALSVALLAFTAYAA